MSDGEKNSDIISEMEETPKSKLIIISKNEKLGKSKKQTFSLKKNERRMEYRFENISENITKRKIDKTLQSLINNKSTADYLDNKKKIIILDYISNASCGKEKYNKNKYLDKYDMKKFRIIEEKAKNLNNFNQKYENSKDNNIIVENNEEKYNYSNNRENSNNNNNTYIDDSNVKKDDIIFIKNSDENIKNSNKNNNNEFNNKLIKNFGKLIENEKNNIKNEETNTEPNIIKNYKNKFKDLLKKDIKKDDEENEEEEEECEEEIISYNGNQNDKYDSNNNKLSSFRDFESNVAIKNDQSERERDNKYIICSCNENLVNFNSYLRNNINISTNNKKEKIITSNFVINKENEDSEKNNECSEEGTNRNLKGVPKQQNLKEINENIPNKLFHQKIALENSKIIDKDKNNKDEKNRIYFSTFNKPSNLLNNASYFSHLNHTICKTCTLCENTYSSNKTFVSECGIHHLCKKCAKNYFEEQIENGQIELHCPFLYCQKKFPINLTKNFISEEHFRLLQENENKNRMMLAKIKSNVSYEKIKLYSKNNVIDINSNKVLYNFNKNKDIFCPKCYRDTLFSKGNYNFLKCLYCNYKECKYCFKDFSSGHIDANSSNRCKVYFRKNLNYENINKSLFFLIQIFLVFAIYIMIFISIFLNLKHFFQNIIRISKNGNFINRCLYSFKLIFSIIFSIIIFLLCFPFIIIWFPYFPSILALSDF